MPINWQRLDALAGKAVNAMWGEKIRITPRIAESEYVEALPDPNREVVEIFAVFSDEPDTDDLRGQRMAGEGRGTTRMSVSSSTLQIIAAEAAKIGYALVDGDLIRLISRPGHPSYSIDDALPLDGGDLVVTLTREKQP